MADLFGVAHRAGRFGGLENTLEVFALTMALGGTPWLETDSWESSDGVLMIHHDLDLCRTTNIDTFPGYDCVVAENNPLGHFPYVEDFTMAFLKTLDVGSWFSPAFVGTAMPTLEEAIALVDGTDFSLLIEVKGSGQAPLINTILTTGGYSIDNIIIWAREPFSYDEFHGVIPGVRQVTGILPLPSITDAFLADRQAKGDYGIGMQPVELTQADVNKIHSYGFLTYSLPTATGMDPLVTQIALGIDGYHTADEIGWNNYIAIRPCLDRVDNDGDGFGDFGGIDLDLDGVHETPPDAACDDRLTLTETTECQDLVDNDGDMLVDLADPKCLSVNTPSETAPPPPPMTVPTLSVPSILLLGFSILGLGIILSRYKQRRIAS
jgi:glycerophosphoryl diester phosphodiesterase